MTSRLVSALLVAAALSATVTVSVAAPDRTDDRYLGSPVGPSSASPVPRATVRISGNHKPGSIIISTAERRLYYINGDGTAIRYGIGVGRDGFTWSGVKTVTNKREWPSWTPPAQMLARRPDLPRHMEGGIDNPLGARAMYLGSTLYRIHGSNEPDTIGQAVSSGCFRLTNDDVKDLYSRVKIGATVTVQPGPVAGVTESPLAGFFLFR